MKPLGYFVHHQGRGHANRATAFCNAMQTRRPVTIFCARDDIFPRLDGAIEVIKLPSLFEPLGREAPALSGLEHPETLHCAPLGWPTITQAVARLCRWFEQAQPGLFMTDVSAELGQLARIASVPHVAVMQHGTRCDPGHMASYEGAVGLLAPYHEMLDQPDRDQLRSKTHFAPGLGVERIAMDRAEARSRLAIDADTAICLFVSGAGGEGVSSVPMTLAARAFPDRQWYSIGKVQHEWHETAPPNLTHLGWVDNAQIWMAASDLLVTSAGNSTVHQAAALGKPWIIVPEWRYFDEQLEKGRAIDRIGAAVFCEHWPSHRRAWEEAVTLAERSAGRASQMLVVDNAARDAAAWADELIERLWVASDNIVPLEFGA